MYVNLNTLMLIFTHKNVKLQLDLVSTAAINAATPQDKKLKARDREHSQTRLFPLALCRVWILWIHLRLTAQLSSHCLFHSLAQD